MTWIATFVAMIAFAANSLLCRFALGSTETDPISFTLIRIVSGGLVLAPIALLRGARLNGAGNWMSAVALFAYAAGFSFAYVSLETGTGDKEDGHGFEGKLDREQLLTDPEEAADFV